MAVLPLCAKLANGQDASCQPLKRRYYQQAVIMNKSDIDTTTVTKTETDYAGDPIVCSHNVAFTLKSGKKGFRFTGSENGSIYFGRFNKATSDLGRTQYTHEVQMLVVGADEESKCILQGLDNGLFVVAMQFTDGTVEVYGLDNGLSTGDYTYSVQENGGGTPIVLSSPEASPEDKVPYVYVSGTPGEETVDFDAAFENPGV